jgi:hypothetical protein
MASPTKMLSPVRPTWTTIRGHLRELRESRAERQSLERELAAYTSESDLNDLGAILDRYSEADTAEIRSILASHKN